MSRPARDAVLRYTGLNWTPGAQKKLWMIFVILMVLWFLGVATSNTFAGYIHILAVFAAVSFIVWLFQRPTR
jgi:hypothetical protein